MANEKKPQTLFERVIALSKRTSKLAEDNGITRKHQKSYLALLGIAGACLATSLALTATNEAPLQSPFSNQAQYTLDSSMYPDLNNVDRRMIYADGHAKLFKHPFDPKNTVAIVSTEKLEEILQLPSDTISDNVKTRMFSRHNLGPIKSSSLCDSEFSNVALINESACVVVLDLPQIDEIYSTRFEKFQGVKLSDVRDFVFDHELIHSMAVPRQTTDALASILSSEDKSDTYQEMVSDVAALILRYQAMGVESGNNFANGLMVWRINGSHPRLEDNLHRTQVPVFITKQLVNDNPQLFMNLEPHEVEPKAVEIAMTYVLERDQGRFFPKASTNEVLAQDMEQLVADSKNINRHSSALISLYMELSVSPDKLRHISENDLYDLLTANIDIVDRHVESSRSIENVSAMLYNPIGHISKKFDLDYFNQATQKFNDSLQTMDYTEWFKTQTEQSEPNLGNNDVTYSM